MMKAFLDPVTLEKVKVVSLEFQNFMSSAIRIKIVSSMRERHKLNVRSLDFVIMCFKLTQTPDAIFLYT